MKQTRHYQKDRKYREKRIQEIGEGNIIVVKEGENKKGRTVHEVSSTGIITVKSLDGKVITKMIATVRQLKKYFENGLVPDDIAGLARYHEKLGWNV